MLQWREPEQLMLPVPMPPGGPAAGIILYLKYLVYSEWDLVHEFLFFLSPVSTPGIPARESIIMRYML